ncbi:gas vesicle synthesis GvpLGvpF [Mesobacillus selenatarsenatis SF-1]|uniref:Gas vesicle synthesis GvpLGvpF n=2 Tax=Mesobacillus selenatarsenatis TaxID=388741 RepID=A0A0A8X5F9_MESS1|nr:gas vesicle synthesis GvpLGvpF [Mesobacillus selenatarsenatis SF-1]
MPKNLGKVIINGEETAIYTIHHQDTAAVVSRVNGEVLPERQNLLAHQQGIMEVMKTHTVIPMSFGNVFNSEEDVILILEHLSKELKALFSQLENKLEVGLKVVAKQKWIDGLIEQDPYLNEWKSGKKDASDPALLYEKIQLGEQVQRVFNHLEQKAQEELFTPLFHAAESGKLNSIVPGKTILNAAFLIDREYEEAFDEKVNQLYEQWKERAEFKYSGPWPPYNFVNIRLRIEQ